ncbi:hypothetical protein [Nitratifractor sp.]
MQAATEIAAYAVAKGETTKELAKMSSSLRLMITQKDAKQPDPNTPRVEIRWKETDDCLVLGIEGQGQEVETLYIEANGSSTDPECDRLRGLIDTERFPVPLRGRMISY